jgi:hypothetical protein
MRLDRFSSDLQLTDSVGDCIEEASHRSALGVALVLIAWTESVGILWPVSNTWVVFSCPAT